MENKKCLAELYKALIKIKSDPVKCETVKRDINRLLIVLILLGIAFGNGVSILISFVSIVFYIILFVLAK